MKILIIGQTPPPYGGQAMMIKYMLQKEYRHVKLFHVRMVFSKDMDERGKFSLYKLFHIFQIIFQTLYYKFRYNISTLYYPPSNSPKISIYRDIFFLICTKYFFSKTILHFHAAGISDVYSELNFIEKFLVKIALINADLTITSSKFNPPDGEFFKGKTNRVIPLGIPLLKQSLNNRIIKDKDFQILFIGILNSTKGEGYLLRAIEIIVKNGNRNIKLNIAGKFENDNYKKQFFQNIENMEISNNVNYLGVITGDKKDRAFRNADLFCFPSFFESESFGIVLLEAMQYKIPIVATRWRGIQSVIENNENGFLVEIKNSTQLAEKIKLLIDNPDMRIEMGLKGFKTFNEKFTIDKYLNRLEKAFLKLN